MKMIPVLSLLFCAWVHGEIYVVPLKDLGFEKSEELTELLDGQRSYHQWALTYEPNMSVRAPEGVRAFLAPLLNQQGQEMRGNSLVAIEVDGDKKFTAQLDIPLGNRSGVSTFAFKFDPKDYKPAKKEEFDKIRKTHYQLLAQSGYIGSPWFNEMAEWENLADQDRNRGNFNRGDEAGDFSFYTGGRAISDNLALDRELQLMKNDLDANVEITSLEGIKTKEIDWTDLMPKEEVAIDVLAMLVPEDQHVLICPSLQEMDKIVSLIENEGSPLAQSFTVRNPFRTLPSRYKKQLGLNFPTAFSKLVPVKSVAVTGYDPFFPTGTDVAVLLESDQPEMLFKMLDEVIKTPEKNMALVGKVVVISNSKAQLARIQGVHAGKIKSLGSLDEYKFFRHRYPVSDRQPIAESKTGFVFLSDACIRRWGGPAMRIAASRRTKSVAVLSHLTARHISTGKIGLNGDQEFLLGKVDLKDGVIESEKMGSLHFMTPTIDMAMAKVTKTEAEAYTQWKRGYEEGWSKVFDPIGFSFSIDDETKELDLTVMPLTVNNEYEDFIKIVGKSVLSGKARVAEDEHVFFASLAIDKDGEMLGQMNTTLTGMMPGLQVKPLDWLGSSVTLFVEKDARWALLENSKASIEHMIFDAPIGLRIEHNSQIKLASFLLALKAVAATAAPDAINWELKKHGEVSYTVVSSRENLGLKEDPKLYYVITKDRITFTLNEEVIKREIDRQSEDKKIEMSAVQENADHFYLKSSSQMLMAMMSSSGGSLSDLRRQQSYRAIPILNEWKRKFKEGNVTEIHFAKFGEDIFCPGGKGYVWNEEQMTMESVVYGHPAAPKELEKDVSLMDIFGELESSMKFEHDGIRVSLKISKANNTKNSKVIFPGTKLLGKLEIHTQVGAKWEYDVSLSNDDGKVHRKVETFENVSNENGKLVMNTNTYLLMGGVPIKFEGERVFSTMEGDGSLALLSVSSRGEKKTTVEFSEPFSDVPAECRSGFKVVREYESTLIQAKATSKYAMNSSVLGSEDVKIGEILYKDCVVIKQEVYPMDGERGDPLFISYTTSWIEPKLGLIKYYEKAFGSEKLGELKSFTLPKK